MKSLYPLLVALVALGCSSNTSSPSDSTTGGGSSCPSEQPSTCTQTPSYAKDVAPILAATCTPCHARGGVESNRDLTTYAHVTSLETTVMSQLNHCLMPPAGATPLSDADRSVLLRWFVCGAPNN